MAEVTCHPNPQGMDTKGSLELSGCWPNSSFNERSCLKETLWRAKYPTSFSGFYLRAPEHICAHMPLPLHQNFIIVYIMCIVRIALIALPYKLQHFNSFAGNLCLQFLTSLSPYMRTFSMKKEPGTASVGSWHQPGLGCYHVPSARTQSRGLYVLRTERK